MRGSQSVLYGSQAIGGVVNLITREPTEDLGVFARAEYGERDTAELVGNVSGRFGPVGVSVGGNYYHTDGISAFSEARGGTCLLYTSPSPRDGLLSRMPSSA